MLLHWLQSATPNLFRGLSNQKSRRTIFFGCLLLVLTAYTTATSVSRKRPSRKGNKPCRIIYLRQFGENALAADAAIRQRVALRRLMFVLGRSVFRRNGLRVLAAKRLSIQVLSFIVEPRAMARNILCRYIGDLQSQIWDFWFKVCLKTIIVQVLAYLTL